MYFLLPSIHPNTHTLENVFIIFNKEIETLLYCWQKTPEKCRKNVEKKTQRERESEMRYGGGGIL